MKKVHVPPRISAEVEKQALLVLQGELSYEEAIDPIENLLEKEEYALFVRTIHRTWARSQMEHWIRAKRIAALRSPTDEDVEQLPLPFPDLQPRVEIGIGRFVHQSVMTREEWDMAVHMAETKASNAAGHLERVIRARDTAIVMLDSKPGAKTLAEVLA